MFMINYAAANEDNSGSVVVDMDSLSDVVTYIESGLRITVGSREMISLLTGMSISNEELDVWLIEVK